MLLLRRLSDWVLNQIAQDVPEDIGLCEFDCRIGQCSQVEWKCCQRRLNRAEGELMPTHPVCLPIVPKAASGHSSGWEALCER
jgi:hypothetical protein